MSSNLSIRGEGSEGLERDRVAKSQTQLSDWTEPNASEGGSLHLEVHGHFTRTAERFSRLSTCQSPWGHLL